LAGWCVCVDPKSIDQSIEQSVRPTHITHLRHPIDPTKQDPKRWLKEGLQLRKQPDKGGRSVRNLVASQMRAGP
jgi:hypothetical protein